MNQERQRIAIAEACGWHHFIINDEYGPDRALKPGQLASVGCVFTDLPDYINDLNAMHEAEKVLGEKRTRSYAFTLAQVLNSSPTVDLDDQFLNINATAAQRAEAFLRTIGKWEEGEE